MQFLDRISTTPARRSKSVRTRGGRVWARGESGRVIVRTFRGKARTSRSSDCATGRTSFRRANRRSPEPHEIEIEIESERDYGPVPDVKLTLGHGRLQKNDPNNPFTWPGATKTGERDRDRRPGRDSYHSYPSFTLSSYVLSNSFPLFFCFECRTVKTLEASTCKRTYRCFD